MALAQAVEAAAEHGGYRALLAARWQLFIGTSPGDWRGLLPDVNFALFVVGLLAVRHRVLDEPLRHARLIVAWMAFGFLSWLGSWLVLRSLPKFFAPGVGWPLAGGLGLIQEQWLCFTYAGAVVLLVATRPGLKARLAPVAMAGRMALTNYLLQAIVLDYLSSGYGLGLRLRPLYYVVAATLLFSLEALYSSAWLSRFRFGPLEWIWRTLTYARPQPLLREPRGAVASASP